MGVVKLWNGLPRAAADAPFLQTSNLDGALNNLIELKTSLSIAGRLEWMPFKDPSNPE